MIRTRKKRLWIRFCGRRRHSRRLLRDRLPRRRILRRVLHLVLRLMLRQILVQKAVFQMPRREERWLQARDLKARGLQERLHLARELERSPVPVERENQE